MIPQFCNLVDLIHSVAQPNGDLYEFDVLMVPSLVRTLNALDCFSVGSEVMMRIRSCSRGRV